MAEVPDVLTPQKISKMMGNKVFLSCVHAVEGRLRTRDPLNAFLRYYRDSGDLTRAEIEPQQRLEEIRKTDLNRLIMLTGEGSTLSLNISSRPNKLDGGVGFPPPIIALLKKLQETRILQETYLEGFKEGVTRVAERL
jgi:hypothetical protein